MNDKICNDCKHCLIRKYIISAPATFHCLKTKTKDVVTGQEVMDTCRESRFSIYQCTYAGNWFEPKDDLNEK